MSAASAPICWTAITCAMACAATWDSAMRIAKRTFAASGEVAGLMVDAGLVVLTAFISPHRAERQMVRERLGEGRFIEVFVDTPLAICEARDPKGLYKKARAGELRNFTGIDSVYEAPEKAEIHLDGEQLVTNLVHQLLDLLQQSDIIRS